MTFGWDWFASDFCKYFLIFYPNVKILILYMFLLKCSFIRQPDAVNQELLARLNASGQIHLTPAKVKGKYVIRFVACQEYVNETLIDRAWKKIQEFAAEILKELEPVAKTKPSRPSIRRLDRTHSQRFSFTRNVSQEIYERQPSMYVI